jgi:hypothetical protein
MTLGQQEEGIRIENCDWMLLNKEPLALEFLIKASGFY